LAALPLWAAFWVYIELPGWIEAVPGVFVPSGREGIWALPILNVILAGALYPLLRKMGQISHDRAKAMERETDVLQVLPLIRLFLMIWLTAICLVVVYGYHVLDMGRVTAEWIGRVSAFVPGVGVTLFAMGLPRAKQHSVLTLRFVYTERSFQVWLQVHKLGTIVLYLTGAIMVGAAFLLSGLWAVITAGLALGSGLFALYLYAKWLYENEFHL